MKSIYLLTGGTSDLGCCLLERLIAKDEGAVFLIQGYSNFAGVDEIQAKFPSLDIRSFWWSKKRPQLQ